MNDETRVLVADENADTRRNIRNLLRERGYNTVLEADNGDTALKMMKSTDFDIAILDVWLGGVDGISLMRAVSEIKGS